MDLTLPIPIPEVRRPLNTHPDYDRLVRLWDFYRLSEQGGHGYKDGLMPDGMEIFIPHEAEKDAGGNYTATYVRRKRWATYTNICGPLLTEHVDFVCRNSVDRESNDAQFTAWLKDVCGRGVPVDMGAFMRKVLHRAARYGRFYVGIDSTRPATDSEARTEAQSQEMDNRLFIHRIDPHNVIDWRETEDVMTECLVRYAGGRAVLWRKDTYQTILLNPENGQVTFVDEPKLHPYGELPVVLVEPFEGESLIGDLSLQAAKLFNLQSLKDEEMVRRTYTQVYVIGADKGDVEQAIGGTSHVICIPNPNATIHTFGAQVEQAESLRQEEDRLVARMRWLAGLRSPDGEQVESGASGYALKLRYGRIDARLVALAQAIERAEGAITRMWSRVYRTSPDAVSPPVYSKRFDVEEVNEVLDRTLSVLDRRDMPVRLKQLMTSRLAKRLLENASEGDLQEIESQIRDIFDVAAQQKEAESRAALEEYENVLEEGEESDQGAEPTAEARGTA